MTGEKMLAVISGGDWADASCDHLVVPNCYSVSEEKKKYDAWYKTYTPKNSANNPFVTFSEWMLAHGARYPTEEELEEVIDVY